MKLACSLMVDVTSTRRCNSFYSTQSVKETQRGCRSCFLSNTESSDGAALLGWDISEEERTEKTMEKGWAVGGGRRWTRFCARSEGARKEERMSTRGTTLHSSHFSTPTRQRGCSSSHWHPLRSWPFPFTAAQREQKNRTAAVPLPRPPLLPLSTVRWHKARCV